MQDVTIEHERIVRPCDKTKCNNSLNAKCIVLNSKCNNHLEAESNRGIYNNPDCEIYIKKPEHSSPCLKLITPTQSNYVALQWHRLIKILILLNQKVMPLYCLVQLYMCHLVLNNKRIGYISLVVHLETSNTLSAFNIMV